MHFWWVPSVCQLLFQTLGRKDGGISFQFSFISQFLMPKMNSPWGAFHKCRAIFNPSGCHLNIIADAWNVMWMLHISLVCLPQTNNIVCKVEMDMKLTLYTQTFLSCFHHPLKIICKSVKMISNIIIYVSVWCLGLFTDWLFFEKNF